MKKKLISTLFSLLLLLSICVITVFCGLHFAGVLEKPDEDTTEENLSFTYTDALGRELTLHRGPARVAALLGSFADVWTLAGGGLFAAPEDAWGDFGLELQGTINIGGAHSPSMEMLLAANPDLVLASATTASHVAMKETLEDAGITVIYFDVNNFEDYLDMLDVCTELTNRKDLYLQYGLAIREQVETVRDTYAALGLPEEERTVLILRASSGMVKAKGSEGTILGEMLADLGCINIADSDATLTENLSVEAVIRAEPRHIFVVTMGNDTEAAMASLQSMMEENPAWGELTAVKEGRLHVMDKTLFNLKPNDRWGEAYQKLYETLIKE